MLPIPSTVVFDKDQIQSAVRRMGRDVAAWLETTRARGLNLVSVLEGARPLTLDLVLHLRKLAPEIELKVQEVRVAATDGRNLLEFRKLEGEGLDPESLGRHPVLVLDDLVDSGKTLALLRSGIAALGPPDLKTAVLVRKFKDAGGDVDYCGFDLELDRADLARKGLKDVWLFGYGMDLDGRHRDLDHIGWVEIKTT